MEKQIVQAGLCRMVKRAHHARKFEDRLIPRVEMQGVSISVGISVAGRREKSFTMTLALPSGVTSILDTVKH
jgi:hypothetical protein